MRGLKLLIGVAVAALVAGCGGGGEETFREHQVKAIARKIEFQDKLLSASRRNIEPYATREEERSARLAQSLEQKTEPSLLKEACEVVPAARICGGNGIR
jgi:hypothetical protein